MVTLEQINAFFDLLAKGTLLSKKKDNLSLGDLADIQLGDKVRDIVTGFQGVADCKMEFLNGCVRWQVQPQGLFEGKVKEAHVFDQQQLALVEPEAVLPNIVRSGGDRLTPKQRYPK